MFHPNLYRGWSHEYRWFMRIICSVRRCRDRFSPNSSPAVNIERRTASSDANDIPPKCQGKGWKCGMQCPDERSCIHIPGGRGFFLLCSNWPQRSFSGLMLSDPLIWVACCFLVGVGNANIEINYLFSSLFFFCLHEG